MSDGGTILVTIPMASDPRENYHVSPKNGRHTDVTDRLIFHSFQCACCVLGGKRLGWLQKAS